MLTHVDKDEMLQTAVRIIRESKHTKKARRIQLSNDKKNIFFSICKISRMKIRVVKKYKYTTTLEVEPKMGL